MIRVTDTVRVMRFASFALAALIALAPVLAVTGADARPGLGGSMGSRGSRTWSSPSSTNSAPYGASPMQRSYAPQGNYNSGSGYGSSYGRPYGYGGGAFGGRSAFTSGLMGGLIGAGLGGLLFGRGFFGGVSGGSGVLGLILQLVLLYFLARFLFRRFVQGAPAFAGGVPFLRPAAAPGARPVSGGFFGSGSARRQVAIAPADYQAFQQLLTGVQAAWSANDTGALSHLATPEMVAYFADQLSDLASRGLRNEVANVQLLQGDLSEAWGEGNRDYATVSMRFAITDITRDRTGQIVDGSPTERVTVTEFWTFVRATGGRWLLSAIQQARGS